MDIKIVMKEVKGRWTFECDGVRMISLKALEWHLRMLGLKRSEIGNVVEELWDSKVVIVRLTATKVA